MVMKVIRNDAGNCVVFEGSTMPVYWNACLSAQVDSEDNTRINIKNDARSAAAGEPVYEFYKMPYTEFQDRDGNDFADASEAATYITEHANVVGVSDDGVGSDLTTETVCFSLDATSTSILFDVGYSYGVNTIKAEDTGDGNVTIKSMLGDRTLFSGLQVGNACKADGSVIPGGIADVVNYLNELFTVGAFTAVVISDPFSTMVADVDGVADGAYTLEGANAVDPEGDDIFAPTSSGNYAGLKSGATIDQAGEYFTFDIRGEGQIGFGLVHSDASYAAGKYSGNANYADPDSFAVSNSAHYGYQFSHWFHPTPNGSWTNYGANTSYVMGSQAWYGGNWDQKQDWIDGNPVKIKVGIDENGYIAISSLQDDSTWVLHARTAYPVPEGGEYHLGIKSSHPNARVFSVPKVHLLEPEAPTMNFRYIESPDTEYDYPLFATEEEANYYDENHDGITGSGTSMGVVYPDDPTNTTWYRPTTGFSDAASLAPYGSTFMSNAINWTEITSLTDADLAPSAFADTTLTVDELTTINYQLAPVDVGYVTSISGQPAGLSLFGGTTLYGTAPEVTDNNVNNPDDEYTITVTRTNSYGSSTGTLTLHVDNLTAPATAITGFTHQSGSATLVDSDTLADGSVVAVDETLAEGERMLIDTSFFNSFIMPALASNYTEDVYIGIPVSGVDWSTVSASDFEAGFKICRQTASSIEISRIDNGTLYNTGYGTGASFSFEMLIANRANEGEVELCIDLGSNNPETKDSVSNGGSFSRSTTVTGVSSGAKTIMIAITGGTMDVGAGLSEHAIPTPASSNSTNWDKAIDFSGNSERAEMVSGLNNYNPMMMAGASSTIGLPSSGQTVSSGHPWATAVVFSADGNNSNQHIWNMGEGAGSIDDNIYLRLASNRYLFFGWGRTGSLNELYIGTITANRWYGIYVASNGARLSGNDANSSNLSNAFDVKLMSEADSWSTLFDQGGQAEWGNTGFSTIGGRMDRQLTGSLTIGGRGANRNFHGKVASFVTTTLRCGQAMPSDAEIKEMITDPMGWLSDYKVGNLYRTPWSTSYNTNFILRNSASNFDEPKSTQVWLMGDGTNDSYSNMIRNQVNPADQNSTKLNLISMVSNDIQNVTISGLS